MELSKLTPRGRKTRQALLGAAEAVFGAQGYERASITAITQAAGVAQGTFYVYFADKQAIFTELVRALRTSLGDALRAAVPASGTRLQIERAGLRAFFAFTASHQNLYRIVRQAEFVDEALYRDYYRSIASAYVEGLQAAMDRGEIARGDAEVLAYSLMGLTDFLGMRFILWSDDDAVDLDALVDEAMAFITHGLARAPTPSGPLATEAGPHTDVT